MRELMRTDAHGNIVTGATPRALDLYERALDGFVAWSGDSRSDALRAVEEAPGFTMGHAMVALLHMVGRDPTYLPVARASLARLRELPQTERERSYAAAIATGLTGDFEGIRNLIGGIAKRYPRDLLALAMAHTLDYLLGDTRAQCDRVAAALPAWSRADHGYHGVLAMYAFGLEETGEYGHAEETAFAALDLAPANLRAHHARAHVLEMQGRTAEGVCWMEERLAHWDRPGASGAHVWWHLSLYHLDLGDAERALEIYDARLAGEDACVSELIDASALLWRLELRGTSARGALDPARRPVGAARGARLLRVQRRARDARLRRRGAARLAAAATAGTAPAACARRHQRRDDPQGWPARRRGARRVWTWRLCGSRGTTALAA